MAKEILRMEDVTKIYDNGFVANKNVTFWLHESEILALVGENGAGKTTLMKVLFGLETPQTGKVYMDGKEVKILNTLDAIEKGIGMVHQHFMLIPSLTVAENVVLGVEPMKNGLFDFKKAVEMTEEVAKKYNFNIDPMARVSDLSVGQMQKIEIMKVLIKGAKIIIMDEPTAVLTPQETEELFEQLILLRNSGHSIIFISHKLEEVKRICTRVTVLRHGYCLGSYDLKDMSEADISRLMVGRDVVLKIEKEDPTVGKTVLKIRNLVKNSASGKRVLDDVSFTIPAGKTFAILGGTGSGKTTLMHLLNRLYDLEEGGGRITIGGVDINQISRAHLRKNVSIVLQEPFLFSRTIRENIGIACPEKDSERMMEYVRKAARSACVDEAIESFTNGYETVVGERGVTLSGGQKQRVAIARMLTQNAPVMIFDDSLSAVDAETDAKIRQELKEKMGSATIILISHRITTLMQADQILVLDQGKVADIGTHEQLISHKGIYQDIYQIQMNNADRELLRQVSEEQPTESR